MATLPSSYTTVYGQSVFHSSNHTQTSTTKLSTHIGHLWRTGQAKKYLGVPDVIVYPVSRHKTWSYAVSREWNLAMSCVKNTDAWFAWNFSDAESLIVYSWMLNIKTYIKIQNCTTKLPCYQICDKCFCYLSA